MTRWIWDWTKYHNSHSSKSIRVTKLFFCQNGVLLGRSFWPKDSLVTLVRFLKIVIKNIQECAFSIWSVCQMVSRTFIQRIDEFFKWFFFLELECSIVIKFSKKNAIISSNTLSLKKMLFKKRCFEQLWIREDRVHRFGFRSHELVSWCRLWNNCVSPIVVTFIGHLIYKYNK